MSVISHLDKGERGKWTATDVTRGVPLEAQGPVLTGEQSVAERIAEDLVLAAQNVRFEGGILPDCLTRDMKADRWGVEQYSSVDEYDAVLASHCRLNGDRQG